MAFNNLNAAQMIIRNVFEKMCEKNEMCDVVSLWNKPKKALG